MNKTLRALYEGELCPAEQYLSMIEDLTARRRVRYQHYEDFIKKLGSPLDQEFARIMDENFDEIPVELTQTFIDGFRLGARMIIEIYEDESKA